MKTYIKHSSFFSWHFHSSALPLKRADVRWIGSKLSPLRRVDSNKEISGVFRWGVEITCFCLQHNDTGIGPYHLKLPWHLCLRLLCAWLLFFILRYGYTLLVCPLFETSSTRRLSLDLQRFSRVQCMSESSYSFFSAISHLPSPALHQPIHPFLPWIPCPLPSSPFFPLSR